MQESDKKLNIIKEGDYVIIKKLHGKTFGKLIKIDLSNDVFISKIKYDIKELIGKEYGTIYLMDSKAKNLAYVENFEQICDCKKLINEIEEEEKKDNRFISNDNKSQKLTYEDITNFKNDGISTKKIIESLVENSSTFNMKTVYSKEKYLKKKEEKYSKYLRAYKPNATLLCELYFNQGPQKNSHIRIDSLGQILNYCNLRAGCKYIVVDTCLGLVTASVLERLIGDTTVFNENKIGKCIQVYTDPGPVSTWRQSIEALNFQEHHLNSCLYSVQIHKTVSLLKDENIIQQQKNQYIPHLLNSEYKDDLEDEFFKNKRIKVEEKFLRKKKRLEEEQTALEYLNKKDFDGLILIARNHNLSEIVDHLLNFLKSSSQFVIFSNYIEPLTECYTILKNKAVNIKLSETWMRNYQILSSRTRPDMEMNGKSGYILYGTKIDVE